MVGAARASTKTSFVIATRNRADELAGVLDRLLSTTPCPIIVVDNHSQDHTVAVARRIGRSSGGRVQVVELPSNRGAVGRNVGVAASRTPYVAFCDDDSWWAPDAPAIAEELFDRFASVALLAARTIVLPQRVDDPMTAQLTNSALGHRPDLPGPSILGFLACAAIVRKAAFEAAGGFSPVLEFRGEEQLLALDLATLGWDLCYYPELVAIHQPSAIRATTAAQDARILRNKALTTWMRRPLARCLAAAKDLLAMAVRDRDHARAAAEAMLRLPAVAARRRPLSPELEDALRRLESG